MSFNYNHFMYHPQIVVKLVSLYTWKDVGFDTVSTDLPTDVEYTVFARDTYDKGINHRDRKFDAQLTTLNRDFDESLPSDMAQKLASVLNRFAEHDYLELHKCLGNLDFLTRYNGTYRPGWNMYNQSRNRWVTDHKYRLVFAMDRTDDKLGVLIGTPMFFRDMVIKDGVIRSDLDVKDEKIKGYYYEVV